MEVYHPLQLTKIVRVVEYLAASSSVDLKGKS
jgi:hypothetical protein